MSGKCKDYRKQMAKDELIALIREAPAHTVYVDKDWEYPDHTSNNGNNVIMQMNFDIEKQAGIVIYIPAVTPEQKKFTEKD